MPRYGYTFGSGLGSRTDDYFLTFKDEWNRGIDYDRVQGSSSSVYKAGALKSPSRFPLFYDSVLRASGRPYYSVRSLDTEQSTAPNFPHALRCNIAFGDGHASAYSSSAARDELAFCAVWSPSTGTFFTF